MVLSLPGLILRTSITLSLPLLRNQGLEISSQLVEFSEKEATKLKHFYSILPTIVLIDPEKITP